jgi:hypothetical protein
MCKLAPDFEFPRDRPQSEKVEYLEEHFIREYIDTLFAACQ